MTLTWFGNPRKYQQVVDSGGWFKLINSLKSKAFNLTKKRVLAIFNTFNNHSEKRSLSAPLVGLSTRLFGVLINLSKSDKFYFLFLSQHLYCSDHLQEKNHLHNFDQNDLLNNHRFLQKSPW